MSYESPTRKPARLSTAERAENAAAVAAWLKHHTPKLCPPRGRSTFSAAELRLYNRYRAQAAAKHAAKRAHIRRNGTVSPKSA